MANGSRFNHWAVPNRSEKEAKTFYQHVLGLSFLYQFTLSSELAQRIFSLSRELTVLVFGSEQLKVEVFLDESFLPAKNTVHHVCLEVLNRESVIEKAASLNLPIIRIPREDRVTVFLKDFSGNIVEIKELQE